MRIAVHFLPRLCLLVGLFCILPTHLSAQNEADGRFGCFDLETSYAMLFKDPGVKLATATDAKIVEKWKQWPKQSFGGWDTAKYGWKQIEFYLGHKKTGSRQAGPFEESEYELTIAIHLTGPSGEKWYEFVQGADPQHPDQSNLLMASAKVDEMQEALPDENGTAAPQQEAKEDTAMEIKKWVQVQFAAGGPGMPLFVMRYSDRSRGDSTNSMIAKELLIDARNANPRVTLASECTSTEVTRGTCGNIASAYQRAEVYACNWEPSAEDFHCTAKAGYGADTSYRTAERDFYAVSGKTAAPSWAAKAPANLANWASRLRQGSAPGLKSAMIPGLGPTTFLARYADLLPETEVLLFASPGSGELLDAHLTAVLIPAKGEPDVQTIEKWDIGGEETAQVIGSGSPEHGEDYTPAGDPDNYTVRALEDRAGFHAIQVTQGWTGNHYESSGVRHVVYWIGLEAGSGKLVTNAVRLASEGQRLSGCNDFLDDATATAIHIKASTAEATVRVQPRAQAVLEEGQAPSCQWSGVIHWKPGAGFRVRKVSEDCRAAPRAIAISDDGSIKAAASN